MLPTNSLGWQWKFKTNLGRATARRRVEKIKQTELEFLDEPEVFVELEDGAQVQKYVPDIIVNDAIIIELKAQTWPMTNDVIRRKFLATLQVRVARKLCFLTLAVRDWNIIAYFRQSRSL